LEARSKAVDVFTQLGDIPERFSADFVAAKKGADDFRALLSQQTERLRNAQAVNRLRQTDVGSGLLNDATSATKATLIGTILGGPLGTAVGAGIDILRNPYSVAQKLAGLRVLRGKLGAQDSSTRGAIRSILGIGAKKSPGRTTRRVAAGLTVGATVLATAKDRRRKSDDLERQIIAYQANPQKLVDHVAQHVTRGMEGAAPTVTARIAAQQAKLMANLAARLPPKQTTGSMLRPEALPAHDDDVRKFLTYAAGALNPASVLEGANLASLAPEALDAIKENWPSYWQHTRQLALDEVSSSSAEIGYSQRLALTLLFDLPGDPALDPGFLQRQQARFEARRQEQQAEPPPPAQRDAADTSASAQTFSQQLSARI
jgi:hypothetical protein